MRDHLTQWRDHIPAQWTEMLDGMNPDFEANARGLDINHDFPTGPAFPPLLRNHDVPSLFRTFREIEPAQVRVIVVGQDPYPEPNRATGRAFEDWAVQNGEVADSCKRFLQSALTCEIDNPQVDQSDADWAVVRNSVARHLPDRASMTRYFDRLAGQGVLFLNVAWTFTEFARDPEITRKKQMSRIQSAHQALWHPVTKGLIERLAARDQPTVFLFMGSVAQNLLKRVEGLWIKSAVVPCKHPGRSSYFGSRNPFSRVNVALQELGEGTVSWWDPQQVIE